MLKFRSIRRFGMVREYVCLQLGFIDAGIFTAGPGS